MLKRLQSLFEKPATPTAAHAFDDAKIAAAALLVSAAAMDADFGPEEKETVRTILGRSFDLDETETAELLALGTREEEEAVDLFGWTRTLKEAYDEDARIQLIENLWEVVYADGVLHEYEASLLRRVTGLIYVPDRAAGEARKRVLARLGLEHERDPG